MKYLDVAPVGPLDDLSSGLLGPTVFVAIIALIVIAIIVAILLIIRKKRRKNGTGAQGITQTTVPSNSAPGTSQTVSSDNNETGKTE